MIVRLDARRLTDTAGMHAALSEAFGFPASYGRNLDALVDCMTCLDSPKAALSRLLALPGEIVLVAIEGADAVPQSRPQIRQIADAMSFVNWRRLEKGQPPIVALACDQ